MTRPLLLLLALVAVAGCARRGPAGLPIVKIDIGGETVKAEIARSIDEQSRGLMYRREMGKNEGMIFVYEQERVLSFWMRNTFIPLDIAYIKADGTIATIKQMQPLNESSHSSRIKVMYALELNQGWFAEHGIKEGSKVVIELPEP